MSCVCVCVSAERNGQHDEYLQWSRRLWERGGEREHRLLYELRRRQPEPPGLHQGVPRAGLRRCHTAAFKPVTIKRIDLARLFVWISTWNTAFRRTVCSRLQTLREFFSTEHTPLRDVNIAPISVDKMSPCLQSHGNPVPDVITARCQRKLNVNKYIFTAFDQEISARHGRRAQEESGLTYLLFFVFQLCQVLSAPRQISPEQKEDHHQEKHHRPRL